jgi:hypothetical protein
MLAASIALRTYPESPSRRKSILEGRLILWIQN